MEKVIKSALICIKDKKLLVVHKKTIDLYILPRGKLEKGEDDITSLHRECKEELGCDCTNLKYWETFPGAIHESKPLDIKCYFGDLKGEIKLNPEDNIDGFIWIDRNYKNIKMANSLQHKIIPELISGGLM